jgi:hypothetical protein
LRNGETCASPVPDDPLEALRVNLIKRQGDGGKEPAPVNDTSFTPASHC